MKYKHFRAVKIMKNTKKEEKAEYVYPLIGEGAYGILRKLCVSQLELAIAAGMSKTTIQKCLKGETLE